MICSLRNAAIAIAALQAIAALFAFCALSSIPDLAANLRSDARGFEAAVPSLTIALAHHWLVPFSLAVLVGHVAPIVVVIRNGQASALLVQALASSMQLVAIGAIWLSLVSRFLLLREGHNCF